MTEPITRPVGGSGTRYEPITQIGRGGMAEVLLSIAEGGGGVRRLVVLKRIWPELRTDQEFVTMFLDEARLSLRLNHANVVQTYEVLANDGELSIAMEYLDGQPLARVLNRLLREPSELSLPLRLRTLISVLAGLEHAHTLLDLDGTPLEVVHRDVSPQNVFITYDGQVKLVDFGVAKTLAASHHTRPGTLKGKLAYMAPEQLQLTSIDRRADLFSVGVMLWEMLAGRRMWQGMTEVDIVAHLAANHPLPSLPADTNLPAGLDAICARALEIDPARRYQTAAEMEMELERVLIGSADSHVRNLGKVVSLAFAAERAERQALVEHHIRRSDPALAAVVSPASEQDSAPTPRSRQESGSIEVTLSEMDHRAPQAEETTPRMRAPAAAPAGPLWVRRVATVAGLAAAGAAILLADGAWRRPSLFGGHVAHGASAPAAVSPGPGSEANQAAPASTPAPAPAAPEPEPARTAPAVVAPPADDSPRPRRRHRTPKLDEDATLPPSGEPPAP